MPKGDSNRKLTDSDITQTIALYLTPLPDGTWRSATAIAREFGVTPPALLRHFHIRGVPIRSMIDTQHGKAYKPRKNRGNPPLCKCGCGQPVSSYDSGRKRWRPYVSGHYRQSRLYQNREWLYSEYYEKNRSTIEIADQCGVTPSSVVKAMKKFDIPRKPWDDAHLPMKTKGEDNGSWRGGVSQWNYTDNWKAIAHRIRQRDSYTCQLCGEYRKHWGPHLHVHHIDADKTNNALTNLISLCAKCHKAIQYDPSATSRLLEIAKNAPPVVIP